MNTGKPSGKTVKVRQTGSPQRRHHRQRETLVGLAAQQDRPRRPSSSIRRQTRGMIAKVAHLVEVVEK